LKSREKKSADIWEAKGGEVEEERADKILKGVDLFVLRTIEG